MIKTSKKLNLLIFFPMMMFCLVLFSHNTFGQDISDIIISDSGNCEENAFDFDLLLTRTKEYYGSEVIILIARLGDGEKSRKYNERRLEVVKAGITAFDRYPKEKVITAQGERVSGKGLVEVYLGGYLSAIFKAERNKNIESRNCNGGF